MTHLALARHLAVTVLTGLLALLLLVPAPAAQAAEPAPVEGYASYDGQDTCKPRAKPGTKTLLRWTVATYGGTAGAISRACGPGTSEHKEGRALDWTVDARRAADRERVQRYLAALFATGPSGEAHDLARRMGVMYVIWNDRMYASYREFAATRYVSSSCRGTPLRRCSAALRHRDHLHVSLSWRGARANTSWYATPQARRLR